MHGRAELAGWRGLKNPEVARLFNNTFISFNEVAAVAWLHFAAASQLHNGPCELCTAEVGFCRERTRIVPPAAAFGDVSCGSSGDGHIEGKCTGAPAQQMPHGEPVVYAHLRESAWHGVAEACGTKAFGILPMDSARFSEQVRSISFACRARRCALSVLFVRLSLCSVPSFCQIQTESNHAARLLGSRRLQEWPNRLPGGHRGKGTSCLHRPSLQRHLTPSKHRYMQRSCSCWHRQLHRCFIASKSRTACSQSS
jgi:hypothetical protein